MDQFLAIAVIFATLFGPVLAVWVTRVIDERRERRQRKLDIFRAMMRNRRSFVSTDYVNAFNLVEIEFQGVATVEQAFKNVLAHYNTPAADQPDWTDKLRRLTTRLLYAMGKDLDYKMEQLDVLEGGYIPQAFGEMEEDQMAIRKLFAEVAKGNKAIPVLVFQAPPQPPADKTNEEPKTQ